MTFSRSNCDCLQSSSALSAPARLLSAASTCTTNSANLYTVIMLLYCMHTLYTYTSTTIHTVKPAHVLQLQCRLLGREGELVVLWQTAEQLQGECLLHTQLRHDHCAQSSLYSIVYRVDSKYIHSYIVYKSFPNIIVYICTLLLLITIKLKEKTHRLGGIDQHIIEVIKESEHSPLHVINSQHCSGGWQTGQCECAESLQQGTQSGAALLRGGFHCLTDHVLVVVIVVGVEGQYSIQQWW